MVVRFTLSVLLGTEISLTLCMLGNFHAFVVVEFFKINFYQKNQEHYQIVKQFGFRSGSTFCRKGYRQSTKNVTSEERVNPYMYLFYSLNKLISVIL